jgi:type II restriction/modification system DNA methylase subunit YeeA
LSDFRGAVNQAPKTLEAINNPDCGWFYRVSADEFQKIPGSPIAYWASETVYSLFTREKVVDYGYLCNGMTTGDNNQFLRIWFEVAFNRNNTQAGSLEDAYISKKKWFPYNKGGDFRRWYGNNDFVINWENNGSQIKEYGHLVPRSMKYMFLPSLTWSKISSGIISFRYKPSGHLFDANSNFGFSKF